MTDAEATSGTMPAVIARWEASKRPEWADKTAAELQHARDGLTKGRSRMREDNERLLLALREIADDYAGRFDMDSPSTNPGMKYVVQQARDAIAKATGCKVLTPG